MSIVVVQSSQNTSTATPYSFSFGAPPNPANTVILGIGCNGGGSLSGVADNQIGNTWTRGPHAQDSRGGTFCSFSEIWFLGSVAYQSGTYILSATAVNGGNTAGAFWMEVSGLNTSNPLDQQGTNQDTAGANTSLTVTCSGSNVGTGDLIVTMYGAPFTGGGVNDWTAGPTSGYTAKGVFNPNSNGVSTTGGYQTGAGAGPSTSSAPAFSANFVSGVIATFQPASAPATNSVSRLMQSPLLGGKALGPLGLGGFALRASAPKVSALAPFFTGPIPNLSYTQNSGTSTYNASTLFTGAASYSIAPAPDSGISFNTGTGVISVDTTVLSIGTHGPYVVTGTNANGSTASNPFTIAETPQILSSGRYRRRFHRMT